MTGTLTAVGAPPGWHAVLPGGRRYAALPSAGRPRIVAEHDPGVLRYVRTSLLAAVPGSAVPPWVFGAARHALSAAVAWRAVPHLPVAPDTRPDSPVRGWIDDGRWRVLVVDHGNDGDGRHTVLLFEPGSATPACVLKIAPGAQGATRLAGEERRLREVAALPLAELRTTIPAPVAGPAGTGGTVLALRGMPGTPMAVAYHRGGRAARPAAVAADFAAAGRWLARFQDLTTSAPDRLDLPPRTVELLVDRLRLVPQIAGPLLDAVVALRRDLRRYRPPQCAVHGDFWMGNILLERGSVTGVVDWERAEVRGSAVRDLARFVVGHAAYLDRHTRPGRRVRRHPGLRADHRLAGVAYALDGTGWYPELTRRFLGAGLERLGLPTAVGRLAVLAEIATVAAEAADEAFCRAHLQALHALTGGRS